MQERQKNWNLITRYVREKNPAFNNEEVRNYIDLFLLLIIIPDMLLDGLNPYSDPNDAAIPEGEMTDAAYPCSPGM